MITITKVVTRNFILDIVANIQNFIGLNLISYEKMIDKGIKQICEELDKNNLSVEDFKWYRYEMNQLTNGAMAIMFYGEEK